MEPEIIFEDNHLLAINKPAGWLVQGDHTGDPTLIDWGKAYLKAKYEKPGAVFLHPVHRIDRPVSGAVLFARTDKALGRLTTLFRERKVEKTYLAIVIRTPDRQAAELRHFLRKDESRNLVSVCSKTTEGAKEAILNYSQLGTAGKHYLLSVQPHTGRPHQIRAQLSAIGCPILGDLKYGALHALPDASIALHCRSMAFVHPVRLEKIEIIAPLPEKEWWAGVDEQV